MPLAIDLFCGLGGWAEGLLLEGWSVIGYDIERHDYGTGVYPGRLVLQDVLTLHGRQFGDADLIVASPPCQGYSYRAMPWSRAKALPPPDNSLFEVCFRIQREACEAAGRNVPMIVENVCGAQKWVGKAAWHFGSFYLWGDVPALMPSPDSRRMKFGSDASARLWRDRPVPRLNEGKSTMLHRGEHGVKQGGGRFHVPGSISRTTSGRSLARKAASARIAMIPLPLSRHIGRVFYPECSAHAKNLAHPSPSA